MNICCIPLLQLFKLPQLTSLDIIAAHPSLKIHTKQEKYLLHIFIDYVSINNNELKFKIVGRIIIFFNIKCYTIANLLLNLHENIYYVL